MSRYLIPIFTIIFFASCETDDATLNRNPNLPNINVSVQINTNLPQNRILQFPGNAVYVPNAGIRGVFVVNTGAAVRAWEASDPNHPPSECSTMELEGILVSCACEGNTYNLYNGLSQNEPLPYPLQEYRAEQSGNVIIVSN